jgi:hypothetical protein
LPLWRVCRQTCGLITLRDGGYVTVRWYWKDPYTLRLEQPGWKEFSSDNTAKLEAAFQAFHTDEHEEVRVPSTIVVMHGRRACVREANLIRFGPRRPSYAL